MNSRPRSAARGFALVGALLIAIATVTAAIGIVVVAGGTRAGVAHTVAGKSAEAIARTGLDRAEAWALEVATGRQDFDRVLDAKLEASCSSASQVTGTGVVPEVGDMYLPNLTDVGAAVVVHNGLRWRLVPHGGGAYLVRYEDNQDDGINAVSSPDWTMSTSNTRSGSLLSSTFCVEGPALPTHDPPGASGVHNPARDRDRAIWINVVGIHPGTDPARALHKSTLRKLLVDNRKHGPGAMRVGGDVITRGGGAMQLCSDESSPTVTGAIDTGSPGSCACGSTSGTTVQLTGGEDGSCGTCCSNENPYEPSTESVASPPNVPNHAAARWYDWGSVCNFHMDATGLYFWDAQAGRGAAATCGAYAGNLVPPSVNTDDQGSCWTPIFLVGSGGVPIEALDDATDPATPEVFTCGASCLQWRPRTDVVSYELGAAPGGAYYVLGSRSTSGTKPDWSRCPDSASTDLRWNPPSANPGEGAEAVGCTTCDGTNPVLTWSSTAPQWRFAEAAGSISALPSGVYVHKGNLVWNNSGGTVPASNISSSGWPMITLVVAGNLNTPNGARMWTGVGTRKNNFTSIVVDGTLRVENGSRFESAGSVYVTGDLLVESGGGNGAFLFGMVSVSGDVVTSAGGQLFWDYDDDLEAIDNPPPPSARLSTTLLF